MNEDLIQKVPLFQQSSQVRLLALCPAIVDLLFSAEQQAFIHNLIGYLQPQIYSPGDMIVKDGEIGNEVRCFCCSHRDVSWATELRLRRAQMYFIRRGKVDVIARGEVVAQLKEGDYFGEIALLEENCKRTASIRVC